ncbi:MAG: hypothetical protein JO159_15695 [Acidobacteria bacterium]|nr:hypothetical protein [Acidobacteriota bacterium]MBV9624478.1 hypothetical protein [Acidobacteriota bacterium]
MHRLTARLLLLFSLTSGLVPLIDSLSPTPRHACCLRRLNPLNARHAQLVDGAPAHGSCCEPIASPHFSLVLATQASTLPPRSSQLSSNPISPRRCAGFGSDPSTRAPPLLAA